MSEYFGIDFGTTNSATVRIELEHIDRYADDQGLPYPSIIAIDRMTGKVKSRGRDAWKKREKLRECCEIITSVKSYLGTDKTWNIGNRTWRPRQVVTEILRGLKEQVSKISDGIDMKSAVVAIPIGFSPIKRRELRKSASDAGINILNFVSEPTSAVFKHYSEVSKWQKIAVFDWGGGTLDIAVVELNNGNVIEMSTLGKPLGGANIDAKVAEWAHIQALKKMRVKVPFKEMPSNSRDDVLDQAEYVKIALSNENEATIALLDYGEFDQHIEIKMNVDKFVSLIEPELNKAIACLKEAIKLANLSIDELGCILMVGGSSKLQGLLKRMCEAFDCEIVEPDKDSDWHVAHGAALLNKTQGEYRVSQNIGLLLSDGTHFPLIKKDEIVGHKEHTVTFALVEDNKNAYFIFLESDDNVPTGLESDRRTIGYLIVPSYGFLFEPIELSFQIDKNLLFTVTAKSSNMAQNDSKTWEYDKIRFSYNLPMPNKKGNE
jgi:molecular chaperone DnaK